MSVIVDGSNGLIFNDASTQTTAATGFGFKNRIINGDMRIDQRNAGASVTTATSGAYNLDRWNNNNNSGASRFTVQQNAGSVTPPAGFINYLGCTSTGAYSISSGDVILIRQPIEGYNIADLNWGTANASAVTLSFWVRSSLTGTFGGSIKAGGSHSYPFTYTINSANTWEQKTVSIPGPTSGTWQTTTSTGVELNFSLGTGSAYAGTANTWAYSSDYRSATGATSVVGTNGATWYLTGVQFEKGSTATAFDYRDYGNEFILCQRYYNRVNLPQYVGFSGFCDSTTEFIAYASFPVTMRDAPSFSSTGYGAAIIIRRPGGGTSNTTNLYQTNSGTQGCRLYATGSGLTTGYGGGLVTQEGYSSYMAWSAEL